MDVAARIATAAGVIGQPAEPVVEHVLEVAGKLADPVGFTDGEARTFGVGVALVREDLWLPRRMAALATGVSNSKALSRAVMARSGDVRIEYAIGPGGLAADGLAGASASLVITGPATLDDDLAAALAIGWPEASTASLGKRLRGLDGERVLRVTVYAGEPGADCVIELGVRLGEDAIARLRAAGLAGDEQLRAIERIGRPAWLRCGPSSTTIGYEDEPVEDVLDAVATHASTQGARSRFAAFAIALEADRARSLELAWNPGGPIALRIGLPVTR